MWRVAAGAGKAGVERRLVVLGGLEGDNASRCYCVWFGRYALRVCGLAPAKQCRELDYGFQHGAFPIAGNAGSPNHNPGTPSLEP
jgi:hypothetical protein